VDAAGNAYVTGVTTSTNFPTTADAFQTASADGAAAGDAFATKLDPSGSALVYSTYLGGGSGDQGCGIAVDANGNAYVTGSTTSTNFPTTAGAFQMTFASTSDFNPDVFVTKAQSHRLRTGLLNLHWRQRLRQRRRDRRG